MIDKPARQQRIREILARNEIHTQDQLHGLLAAERISITQATLSRDLRDIGAVRRPDGYSIDVNASAKLARFGAATIKTPTETMPPTTDATTARLIARSALPARASR